MSSQSRFRVFLDGNLIIDPDGSVNEPNGLLDCELKIIRDENLKGIFLEYITDVVFWGASYEYIRSIYQNNDDCAKIEVTIDYQCGNDTGWETLFEGQIPVGSEFVEWDDFNCSVKTKIENADFSNLLQTFGDLKIGLNSQYCIDGTTLLAPVVPSAVDPFTGFFGILSGKGVLSYSYIEVLQQILSYLSNNRITLIPDPWYSTQYIPQQIVLNLVNNLGAPSIDFTNYFGQQRSVTMAAGQINEFAAAMLHKADPDAVPYEDRDNVWEKASYANVAGLGITFINYMPWQSYNFTYAPGFAAIEIPFQYGLKNLSITTNTALQGQNVRIFLTLNQLLRHATEFSNMGYRMVKSGSGYQFHLLRQESLIDPNNISIELDGIRNITHKSSGEYNLVALTTPSGKADVVFKEQSYNTGNCYGDNLKLSGKNYSSQEIFDFLVNTTKQDDELVYFFLDETDPTIAQQYAFRFQVNNVGQPGFSAIYSHYNAPYFQAHIAARYNINTGLRTFKTEIPLQLGDFSGCLNCPAAEIPNDQDTDLKRLYSFEAPLSYDQIKAIRDESLQGISFTDNLGVNRNGFIKSVTIPFKDFIATFEVYSGTI